MKFQPNERGTHMKNARLSVVLTLALVVIQFFMLFLPIARIDTEEAGYYSDKYSESYKSKS